MTRAPNARIPREMRRSVSRAPREKPRARRTWSAYAAFLQESAESAQRRFIRMAERRRRGVAPPVADGDGLGIGKILRHGAHLAVQQCAEVRAAVIDFQHAQPAHLSRLAARLLGQFADGGLA